MGLKKKEEFIDHIEIEEGKRSEIRRIIQEYLERNITSEEEKLRAEGLEELRGEIEGKFLVKVSRDLMNKITKQLIEVMNRKFKKLRKRV